MRKIRTKDIIDFFQGSCSQQKSKDVASFLKRNPEVIDKLFPEEDWLEYLEVSASLSGTSHSLKSDWTNIWNQIYCIDRKKDQRKRLIQTIGVAASIGLIFFTGFFLLIKTSNNNLVSSSDNHKKTINPDAVSWANKGTQIEKRRLSDGSLIFLEPQSTLYYQQKFAPSHRWLKLDGKAKFVVAKDLTRPFTVFSGSVSTTALGTIFTVDNRRQGPLVIHLIKGKVLVSNSQTGGKLVLHPGEFCRDNKNTLELIPKQHLNYTYKQSNSIDTSFTLGLNHADFRGTALLKVFSTLETLYRVRLTINIPKAELQKSLYSGHVDINRISIESTLDNISSLTNLGWAQKDSMTYEIRRKK